MKKTIWKKVWQNFNKPFWTPFGMMGWAAWGGALLTERFDTWWWIYTIIWMSALWVSFIREDSWGRKLLKLD